MIKRAISILKEYKYSNINFRLIIYVTILCIIGVNVIDSATNDISFGQKQMAGMAVGAILMIIVALFDYKYIFKYYWVFYFFNILLLLGVKFLGAEHGGAQRWIDLPGFQLQPSELTKLFLIIFFARFIFTYREHINSFKFLICVAGLMAVPAFLILKQPDLSTTIVIVLTFCAIMFLSGLSMKIILGLFAVAIPIVAIGIFLIMQPNQQILEQYQYNRIIGFFDKDNAAAAQIRYQQENSILAIGSGGLYGKGLNNNTITSVKNGNYLSEPHTDFIFTVVGEELGFVGCVGVIVLIALIVFECCLTGARSPDLSSKLFCCGFGALIAIQTIINISVVTMLIPNTGLTLPFISYGLNSILSLFVGIGIVINIGLQRRKNNYYEEELN